MKTVIKRYRLEMIQESAKRYECECKGVSSPRQAAEAFEEVFHMTRLTEEFLGLFCLDTKNNVIGAHVVAQGAINKAIIHPREVFKRAILNNSARIMICHNHPSGDCSPSVNDEAVTKRLEEAGELLGIDLIDHLIIGHENGEMTYCSLKEQGLL